MNWWYEDNIFEIIMFFVRNNISFDLLTFCYEEIMISFSLLSKLLEIFNFLLIRNFMDLRNLHFDRFVTWGGFLNLQFPLCNGICTVLNNFRLSWRYVIYGRSLSSKKFLEWNVNHDHRIICFKIFQKFQFCVEKF